MRILLVGRRPQIKDWFANNTIWKSVDTRSHFIRGPSTPAVDFYWCAPEAWEDMSGVYVDIVIHLGTPIAYRQFFNRLIRSPTPA